MKRNCFQLHVRWVCLFRASTCVLQAVIGLEVLWKFSQDKEIFLPWYSPLVVHAVAPSAVSIHTFKHVFEEKGRSLILVVFWPLQYDELQCTTITTPATKNKKETTLACCPSALTVYIQYMFESHFQISELTEGRLIYHSRHLDSLRRGKHQEELNQAPLVFLLF